MSRLNELLHGEASVAADLLSGDVTPARDEILLELRAALTNALHRISLLEDKATIPVPVREIYRITVEVAAPEPFESERLHDLDVDVAGRYRITAISEDDALDQFHSTVPIKVLDDFEISVELDKQPRCPDCGTECIEEAIGQVCDSCHRGVIA